MKQLSKRLITALVAGGLYSSTGFAQDHGNLNLNNLDLGSIHGSFQALGQYYIEDSTIGAAKVPEKMGFNGFLNLIYTKGNFTAGIRYESYLNELQGYPAGYKGNGIGYRFADYRTDFMEVTVGNFYEQFGSGLTLRTYQEFTLGVDNSIDGVRVKAEPIKGIYLKGLIGKQREFFTEGPGLVRGFDGEIQLNEAFKGLADKKLVVALGGSFVSKYQADQDPTLVLPQNVGNSAGRIRITRNNFTLYGEYANKINDPSLDNKYNYKSGDAYLLQTSYAKKGFAVSLAGSRIDNMSYRSDRNAQLTNLMINYIPALNKQHTYSLLAFYPYASQSRGEMEYSSEVIYKIKKGTVLGGKYGTEITVNYSGSNGLDTTNLDPATDTGHKQYKTNLLGVGKDVYFRDLYFEIYKKFNKEWKATLIYSYQVYNKDVIQKPGGGMIYSNIQVLDVTYKFKPESAVRLELQNLSTRQDHQSWAYGLLEYTINPSWYVAVGDQYNYGNDIVSERYHYYTVGGGFIKGANRIELMYGKQREGIFCVGGVCRTVPASNGVTLTITSSF